MEELAKDQFGQIKNEYSEEAALGKGMLRHYFSYCHRADDFEVVEVELEAKVDIPKIGVKYGGRLDGIVKKKDGTLWVLEHKTARAFNDLEKLVLDEQCTSYIVMAKLLGYDVKGVIYNVLKKKIPTIPGVVVKGDRLYSIKLTSTTYELYMKAIKDNNFDAKDYTKQLNELVTMPNPFFRRTEVVRSDNELRSWVTRLGLEAEDMLGDPNIYPTFSFWCQGCGFYPLCMMMEDGSDVEYAKSLLTKPKKEGKEWERP